jgi:thiamine pyrophosphate-dependent acetolactate synthase large subunit-like protein
MDGSRDTMTTGAASFVSALEGLGVSTVFGLPGVHNLPIWKALAASKIDLIGVRHEQTAVYAADGYARATGNLGVAVVTTGPGAANTLAATGEAMASGSPVLIVATDIPIALRRPGVYRGVLHETRDQGAMFGPLTKRAQTVSSAEEIYGAVLENSKVASSSPSGPVYLGIPTDLLSQPIGVTDQPVTVAPDRALPDAALIENAVSILNSAKEPLIWAGGGALRAGAGGAIGALANRLDAPVITTYMARGLIPADHPYAVPGPVQAPEVGALWDSADVVLAIGTDFDGMMTQNWTMPPPRTLIAINVDSADANKNYPCDLTLIGDARILTEVLVEALTGRDHSPDVRERLKQIGEEVVRSIRNDDPAAARFLDVMDRVLPDDAIVVVDMCIPGYWLGAYRRVAQPRKLAYPVGWGTLGFGFPGSLGAAVSGVGRAVCVSGDGGFLFACGELATVAQNQLPVTIVLVDDGGYGMLRFDQHHAGDQQFGVDLATPDFEALSRSFGVEARTVVGFDHDFEEALSAALAVSEPRMIVVKATLKPPLTTSPRWYRRQHATLPR